LAVERAVHLNFGFCVRDFRHDIKTAVEDPTAFLNELIFTPSPVFPDEGFQIHVSTHKSHAGDSECFLRELDNAQDCAVFSITVISDFDVWARNKYYEGAYGKESNQQNCAY
jgi:hypothetical protein